MMKSLRFLHTSSTRLKIMPKNLKGKSKSSQEWLLRQLNDPYVNKAREMQYRARSAFKLIEMDDKIKILKAGQTIIECGAAPGAWTQVIVQRINSDGKNPKKPIGKVIGIDLLPIDALNGADFLPNSDFTCEETQSKILSLLGPSQLVDIILSDMAPNATGLSAVDHPRIISLVRKVICFAVKNGKVGSHFLTKVWDGDETKFVEEELTSIYQRVTRLKPQASRNDSKEIFIFARSKKP